MSIIIWKMIQGGHHVDTDGRFVIQQISSRPHGCRWVLTDLESDDGEVFDAPRMMDCEAAAEEIMSHPGTIPILSANGLDDCWTIGVSRRYGRDLRGTHYAPGDRVAWSPFDGVTSVETGPQRQAHWSALVQAKRAADELQARLATLERERAREPLSDQALLDRIEHLQSTGVGRIADTLSDTIVHATATQRASVGPIPEWAVVTGTVYEAGVEPRRFGVRVDLPPDVRGDEMKTLVRMAIAQAIDDPEAFDPPEEMKVVGKIQDRGDAQQPRSFKTLGKSENARTDPVRRVGADADAARRPSPDIGTLRALAGGNPAGRREEEAARAKDNFIRQGGPKHTENTAVSRARDIGRAPMVSVEADSSDRIARRLRHPDNLIHQAAAILRAAWGDRVPHSLLGGCLSTELIYEIWDDLLMDDAPFRAVAGGLDAESLVEEACDQYKFAASFLHST